MSHIPPPPVPPEEDRPSGPIDLGINILWKRKPEDSDSVRRDTEKEKIKRQLYNLIDRVDKL